MAKNIVTAEKGEELGQNFQLCLLKDKELLVFYFSVGLPLNLTDEFFTFREKDRIQYL